MSAISVAESAVFQIAISSIHPFVNSVAPLAEPKKVATPRFGIGAFELDRLATGIPSR